MLSYRYESWVQYISAPPMSRVDLHPLATELSTNEPEGRTWTFDGVEAITPNLRLKGPDGKETGSAITPEAMVDRVITFLEGAIAAWDPYDRPNKKPGVPQKPSQFLSNQNL